MIRTLILIVLLFNSIVIFGQKLTNHYRNHYQFDSIGKCKVLEVNVSLLPDVVLTNSLTQKQEEIPANLYLYNWRDSLPHIIIKLLSSKIVEPDKFKEMITQPFGVLPPTKAIDISKINNETDQSKITLRWLFSNIKKYYKDSSFLHPNTRLDQLNTTVIIDTSSFMFYTVDKLENEFESIDLGTLNRTNTAVFNSSLQGHAGTGIKNTNSFTDEIYNENDLNNSQKLLEYSGADQLTSENLQSSNDKNTDKTNKSGTQEINAGLDATGNLGYTVTNSTVEDMSLKYRRLKSGISFRPDRIILSQRGGPLVEISENVVLTTTLVHKNIDPKISYAFDKIGKPDKDRNLLSEVKIKKYKSIPCSGRNLSATVIYEGVIRRVINTGKGKKFLEFDDKIEFCTFYDTLKNIPLILEESKFCKNYFWINVKEERKIDETQKRNIIHQVRIQLNFDDKGLLIHNDDSPEKIKDWLQYLIDNFPSEGYKTSNYSIYLKDGEAKNYLAKDSTTSGSLFVKNPNSKYTVEMNTY